jgi:hypothetical protein
MNDKYAKLKQFSIIGSGLILTKVDKKYAATVSSRLKSIQGDCSINILQQSRRLYACWPLEGA